MQLELGQLIIDAHEGYRDTGIVIEVYEDFHGDPIYSIYWVCPRNVRGLGKDYTTILSYTEEELKMEYSHCFEIIELK